MRPCVPPRALKAVVLVLALTGLSALAGCGKPVAKAEPPAPVVGVVESRRMNVPILVTPNGTTRALEEVTIRARVRGFLSERLFEEGAFVKKGQLLLVIDEEPYKVALRSAVAKQAETSAALEKAEKSKGREVSAAQLDLSRAQLQLARFQERRSQALLTRGAGPAEELEKSEAERKRWEAQVEADVANVEQAKADYEVGIAAAKAQVQAAKAAVRDAELNLGYCRMVAPIDGRIGQAVVKVGNLVGPESAGGGAFTELASIRQLDPMGVDVQVSSRDLDQTRRLIHEGQAVKVARPGISGGQEHPHEGTLYFVDNAVDETTSTFLAKARIPNPGESLLPGDYVKLRVIVAELENAVVVPSPSVAETDAGTVVHVVDASGKVAVRRVKAAQSYEGLRVITKGLEPGVNVIVEGLQMIRPGMAVKTEPARRPEFGADLTSKDAAAARPGPKA